ncbi:MAG: hypothetical protein A2275_12015 [Bacteroidetes bacterium RIFOXYA12_FULL_35_11]|nr:MAG: hypothetical protein A2X01_16930 [Bacteroidetes bacterium GWF2_35_48]OFY82514.1 MAG: hypothetical protein A2275_12015 [Bacteroidetes bacterium RIFOXYA12_FULL_35_11]OFY94847.1 MAG: hypothetical protein A2309_13945 [Bacteroidetes bacterium RIFOXYB2_FULL_35_7]HBX53376.1 molybdenum cofactor synthesis protein [Bacteroidales bacterium]
MNNKLIFRILSVNMSEKKGTIKKSVSEIKISSEGIEKDAHAGLWHRQISLLGVESIRKFEASSGRKINFGEFAENITTEGLLVYKTQVGDIFKIGEVELEVTQIGKKCHGAGCAIYEEVGNCIMPKEGIFCKVLQNGTISADDTIEYFPQAFRIAVITLSDRAFKGEYQDKSGPEIIGLLNKYFEDQNQKCVIENIIIPDDSIKLKESLDIFIKQKCDVIFTTGGTGIGQRDITVDTVKSFEFKEMPGIMEFIRMKYGQEKPNALLSRSVAGIIDETFIYTLPGSVKAVNEYLSEILKTLNHLFYTRAGIDNH